jgi:hypothetical protein
MIVGDTEIDGVIPATVYKHGLYFVAESNTFVEMEGGAVNWKPNCEFCVLAKILLGAEVRLMDLQHSVVTSWNVFQTTLNGVKLAPELSAAAQYTSYFVEGYNPLTVIIALPPPLPRTTVAEPCVWIKTGLDTLNASARGYTAQYAVPALEILRLTVILVFEAVITIEDISICGYSVITL